MDKIANPDIQRLTDTLCSTLPTEAELRHAMALAYACGKNDGSLETCERLLKKAAA